MSNCCNEFEFTNPQGTFYMDGGIRGKDGVTFYPHVSAAGILSWTNDGGKQNPDPVNIKGEDGMSAYAAAQEAGFTGTEQEFNAYLAGIGELTEDVDDLKSAVDQKAPVIIDTASGAIASFEDGADGMPIKALTVNIEPVQAGTGDPSPTNVRPISGWTGCNIHVSPTTTGGTVCPITFPSPDPGTVYGGTLDAVSGVLTVEKGLMTINENSSISVDSGGFYVKNNDVMRLLDYSNSILCNRLKTVSDHIQMRNVQEGISAYAHATALPGQNWIYFKPGNSEITTVEEVKAWLTDNPIEVLYPLAVPRVYDLSDIPEITTLLGENNIWADAGSVDVEYPADTKQYIQREIATSPAISSTMRQAGWATKAPIASCDDAAAGTIYGVSSSGGTPRPNDFPMASAGYLLTMHTDENDTGLLQLAYPFDATQYKPKYRTRKSGTWTSWMEYGGTIEKTAISNTYNINTSPTITTDSNGWLQPVDTETQDEAGKTDMTGAIMSMLTSTGYCHLAPGIYYVSGNIDLPAGATLEGCGKDTIVRLLSSVTSGYICRMHTKSTIKNICFSGGYSEVDASSADIGSRNGIIYIGNRDGNDSDVTPRTTTCCMVTQCWFNNFSGSAIYGYNAGGGLQEGMICSDCYIYDCKAGINLDYWTEYCKFSNVIIYHCYYACINNGGNNVFVACTFHGTIGFLMDNSNGDKRNNSHGSVIGCTFNHIDNWNRPGTLGGGDAVKILNSSNGFIFTGCQIFYGAIHVEESRGIAFSDCLFGGNTPNISATGSFPIFFNGCIFHAQPSISAPTVSKFDGCYLDSTGASIGV